METTIRKIGNSRGIIIPQSLIEKYDLKRVSLEETDSGILLKSIEEKSEYEKGVEELRRTKHIWQAEIEKEANDPDTIAYYEKVAEEMEDWDMEIME